MQVKKEFIKHFKPEKSKIIEKQNLLESIVVSHVIDDLSSIQQGGGQPPKPHSMAEIGRSGMNKTATFGGFGGGGGMETSMFGGFADIGANSGQRKPGIQSEQNLGQLRNNTKLGHGKREIKPFDEKSSPTKKKRGLWGLF